LLFTLLGGSGQGYSMLGSNATITPLRYDK
jgi:hypothetical protein